MSTNIAFRVPPRLEYKAEVIVLITSLGVKRREYNTSRQAMDLLEIIRCHYKLIDFNIDTDGGGIGGSKPDLEIVRQLYQSHRVRQDKTDGMINLPQVIIDGVNVGDHQSLQALEDDGYLDEILRQVTCPRCLTERSGEYCYNCKTLFQNVMPGRQEREAILARLKFQEIAFVVDDDDDEEEEDREADLEQDESRVSEYESAVGSSEAAVYPTEVGDVLPQLRRKQGNLQDDGNEVINAMGKLAISQKTDSMDECSARDGASDAEVFVSARDKPFEFESEPTIENIVIPDKA